ncbi:uncharacterized protein LOC106667298 isoform X2 [Cimex lectularius]|uniref:Uncharacterized protein n=1 Tax=Cimex lectularius TaxID=79782 RepID=A0A8I6RSF1_CIMLE|nr:uncharacterized protein LOC106667298 isoform X2 [Cimex lectularius]
MSVLPRKKIMFGCSFLWTVLITLKIFVLVYNDCTYAEGTTYGRRIISGDELNLRHLIGRRQDQISFYHKCLFNLSPYNQYLMKQWLVYHLNVLKFDLAQMTPSANETDKNLIKQLDEDYWDSEPSINGPDSAFRKYEYILTFFYHQLESYVNTPADLETPYWKKIRKFVTTNLFV